MDFIKKMLGMKTREDFRTMIHNGAKIVDVRTPMEFQGGHPKGAINIPLDKLPHKINEIKRWNKPVILCCASGMRSGQARAFLSQHGVEAYNAGSWCNLDF